MHISLLLILASTLPGTASGLRGIGLEETNLAERQLMREKSPKSSSKSKKGQMHSGKMTSNRLLPSNAYCLSEIIPIFQDWYRCQYGTDPMPEGACPIQTDKVPPKTTFLRYSLLPSCDAEPQVRVCDNIPSDHWIIISVAGFGYLSDFVDTEWDNQYDTPESLMSYAPDTFNNITNVVAKVDGEDVAVPRVFTESICNLPVADRDPSSCHPDVSYQDGWSGYFDGYWLRLEPFAPGKHTIEFSSTGEPIPGGCAGNKYELNVV